MARLRSTGFVSRTSAARTVHSSRDAFCKGALSALRVPARAIDQFSLPDTDARGKNFARRLQILGSDRLTGADEIDSVQGRGHTKDGAVFARERLNTEGLSARADQYLCARHLVQRQRKRQFKVCTGVNRSLRVEVDAVGGNVAEMGTVKLSMIGPRKAYLNG